MLLRQGRKNLSPGYKMPLRRRPTKLRRIRRRRYGRRPMRRIPRRPTTYAFKRQYFLENNIVVPNGGLGIAQTFALNLLPSSTDFTNLYDMYMIKKVVVKYIPKINTNPLTVGNFTVGNADLCQVHSAIDYDDSAVPGSVQPLVEYQSYKMTRGSKIHTRVLVPRAEVNVEGANASPKAWQWLDCDNAGITHRGLKVFFSGPSTVTNLYFDTLVTYYFSCKHVL